MNGTGIWFSPGANLMYLIWKPYFAQALVITLGIDDDKIEQMHLFLNMVIIWNVGEWP